MNIKVRVPATTANFGPGFDCFGAALKLYCELECIVDSLNLSNYFVSYKKDKKYENKFKVEVEGEGKESITQDKRNIVYQAIKKVCNKAKKEIPSIYLKINNSIPVARGLGSSAAAIVGGVIIGNVLCGSKFCIEELINVATEIEGHPDNVVPAMVGGFCVSKLNNGKVDYLKLNIPEDIVAFLVIPDFQISTKKARKVLPDKILFENAVKNICNSAMLVMSLQTKKYDFIKFSMQDYIHQPFRKKLMPWMDKIFEICQKNKALGVALSGSGSTVLALYKKSVLTKNLIMRIKKLISRKIKSYVKENYFNYKVLNFTSVGVQTKINN